MRFFEKEAKSVWGRFCPQITAGISSANSTYITDFLAKKQDSSGFFQAITLKVQEVKL